MALRPRFPDRGRYAVIAAVVFVISLAVLVAVHQRREIDNPLSDAAAAKSALVAPGLAHYFDRHPYDRYRVTPLDSKLLRVTFLKGPRVVLDAAVAPNGQVPYVQEYKPGYIRAGSEVSQRWWVLALLAAAFLLATLRLPILSLRNLDALALVSFVAPVVLLNARLFELSVWASYPQLFYLAARCLWVGIRGTNAARCKRMAPLFDRLTSRLKTSERERVLGMAVAAFALVLVMVSYSSRGFSDVGIASMAGATTLLDGTLPYGNLPEVLGLVHGDTYPLLAYVFYIPAALIEPVRHPLDSFDGALWVSLLAALLAGLALYRGVRRLPGRCGAASQVGSRADGLRTALAWFTFPPVLITTSSGSNDLVLAACVAFVLALGCTRARSTLLLTVAGWVKLIPLLLLPIWISRFRSGGVLRAIGASAVVTGAVAACLLLLGGADGVTAMLREVSFQFERGSLLSLWAVTGLVAVQIALQAALAAAVVVIAIRIWREPGLASDPWRLAALLGGLMLGFQLVANYWTYAYLVWVFPCVALGLLYAREVAERHPAPAESIPKSG